MLKQEKTVLVYYSKISVCGLLALWQVRYWRKSMENEASAQRISSRDNQTRLDSMKPNSNYVVEVRAFNGAGYGPTSQRREIRTEKARKDCS